MLKQISLIYKTPLVYHKDHKLSLFELRFYQKLIKNKQSILELGCGTGRLYKAFKNKNYYGLDRSYPMLSFFKNHSLDANLILASWYQIPIKQKFDYILMARNSYFHIHKNSLKSFLNNLKVNLNKHSQFILELDNIKSQLFLDYIDLYPRSIKQVINELKEEGFSLKQKISFLKSKVILIFSLQCFKLD